MLLTLELLLQILGRMSVKTSALGAIPPFYYPGIRNWMKEDPASTLGIHIRLCGKRQWKKSLDSTPTGRAEGGLHGYAIPRPAVGQLVRDQRVSRFDCLFRPAHADGDIPQG